MAFDLSSPRSTIHSFVGSLNQYNYKQAGLCVRNANPKIIKQLVDLAKARKNDEVSKYIINKIDITIDDANNTATATVALSPDQSISHLQLVRQDDKWKIVPVEFHPANIRNPLSYIASLLASLQPIKINREHEDVAYCQTNLKQLSLTVSMFEQDNNNIYSFTNKTWIESLKPYMTAAQRPILICPDDKSPSQHSNGNKTSYSFNDNLTNCSGDSIKDPSKTVMLYEGTNTKLNFRHNGKANVAFADGYVKLISSQEAQSLRWTP